MTWLPNFFTWQTPEGHYGPVTPIKIHWVTESQLIVFWTGRTAIVASMHLWGQTIDFDETGAASGVPGDVVDYGMVASDSASLIQVERSASGEFLVTAANSDS